MDHIDYSNGTEVQALFDDIVKTMRGIKITSVFSKCPSFSSNGNVRIYDEDTEIYILFENEKCLVIDYRFVDSFNVILRLLSSEELLWYKEAKMKDFFNDSTDIYSLTPDNQTVLNRTQRITLEYSSLASIELEYITKPYSKWINGRLDEVSPKTTTFEKILFKMANGKAFAIQPEDAVLDGYTLVWSDDAEETITQIK